MSNNLQYKWGDKEKDSTLRKKEANSASPARDLEVNLRLRSIARTIYKSIVIVTLAYAYWP